MSLSTHFKTNHDLERKGVDVEFPPNDDGSIPTFTIARAGSNNPDYQKVSERIMKPHRRAIAVNAVPRAQQDRLTREIFAEAGLVGWRNVLASDVTGNSEDTGFAEYSKDAAVMLLTNLPDLYASLIEISVTHSTFQDVEREADAKNSVKSLPIMLSKATPKEV